MQDCSESLVCTAIAEAWMSVENVINLRTVDKFFRYILYFSNLLIIRLNNADYTIANLVKIK